ncbi:MAG: hypothetical protein KDA92_26865, partial [Planctomycetales bacterium]|nr:hypothetical protein [Planctomycetales bacterium]
MRIWHLCYGLTLQGLPPWGPADLPAGSVGASIAAKGSGESQHVENDSQNLRAHGAAPPATFS